MCDNCVTIGETFHHNANCEPGASTIAYTRSVLAFPCPVCGRGLQRPTCATLDAEPGKMLFTCDACESAGTRNQINGVVERACGNYYADEVSDMRYPNW